MSTCLLIWPEKPSTPRTTPDSRDSRFFLSYARLASFNVFARAMNPLSPSVDSPLVAIVQSLYAAFARRDIPSLLAQLAAEVEWRINVDPAAPAARRIPDFRPFRGREGVQAFFSIIEEEFVFHSFDPVAFLTGANQVAARVKMDLTVKSTGNRLALDVIHLFVFDSSRRVSRFIEYMDTLAAAWAWEMVEAKA